MKTIIPISKIFSCLSVFLFMCLVVIPYGEASNVYDGTWTGIATSSSNSGDGGNFIFSVSSDIMNSITMLVGFRISGTSCFTIQAVPNTTNLTTDVSSGSFTVNANNNEMTFTGTFSGATLASGTWTGSSNANMCNVSSSGTWTATKGGTSASSSTTTTTALSHSTTTTTALSHSTTTTTALSHSTTTTTATTTAGTTTALTTTGGSNNIKYTIPYLHTDTNNVIYCVASNMTSSSQTGYVMVMANNVGTILTPSYESTTFSLSGKTSSMLTFSGHTLTAGSTPISLLVNTGGSSSQTAMYSARLTFSSNDTTTKCKTMGLACFQGTTSPKRNVLGIMCDDNTTYTGTVLAH